MHFAAVLHGSKPEGVAPAQILEAARRAAQQIRKEMEEREANKTTESPSEEQANWSGGGKKFAGSQGEGGGGGDDDDDDRKMRKNALPYGIRWAGTVEVNTRDDGGVGSAGSVEWSHGVNGGVDYDIYFTAETSGGTL